MTEQYLDGSPKLDFSDHGAAIDSFHSTLRTLSLDRSIVFGEDDAPPTLGSSFLDRSAIPTWVGPKYRTGGVVLMALNPGGGASKRRSWAHDHDEKCARALKRILDERSLQVYLDWRDEVQPEYMRIWKTWLSISAVLEALNLDLDDIAFGDLIPFRMAGGESQSIKTIHFEKAWHADTAEVLELLQPSLIVCMTSYIDQLRKRYLGSAEIKQFRRAQGDSHITPRGQEDLDALRQWAIDGEESISGSMTEEEVIQRVLKLQARRRAEAKTDKTDKSDTPATPVSEMTPEETRDFLLSLPKEKLIAALDIIRAEQFAEKEEK